MIRRDLLKSEIEKIAEVIAKILRLRNNGQQQDAYKLFLDTLEKHFGIDQDILFNKDLNCFKNYLADQETNGFEKLESLAEIIYQELCSADDDHKTLFAQQLDLIYKHLNNHFKVLNLNNIAKQTEIQKYL
jgi:hypothetical protein